MSTITENASRNSILPEPMLSHLTVEQRASMRHAEHVSGALLDAGFAIRAVVRRAVAAIANWRRRQATAAELAQLDARLLADIGIERYEIGRVAAGLIMPLGRATDPFSPNFGETGRAKGRRAA